MALRIDPAHNRFRDIVRGKIKQNLRKYISQGEMIARKGKDTVAIPLPSVDIPHFKHGDKQQGGWGRATARSATRSARMARSSREPARRAIARAIT